MDDFGNNGDQLGDDSSFIQIAGQITMVATVLLFMIVVFFFFLNIYARKYWWRVEDHGQRFGNSRAVSGGQAANRVVTMSEGLDQTILESLPVVVFSSEVFKDGLECSVCLSEVIDGEKARLLPKCNHGFHVDCIDMWFQSHTTCPLCRHPVSSPLGLSESEATTTAMDTTDAAATVTMPRASLESSSQSHFADESGPSHTVIDIPTEIATEIFSSGDKGGGNEAKPTPLLTRIQTFKRLLSRENREAVCSSSSV